MKRWRLLLHQWDKAHTGHAGHAGLAGLAGKAPAVSYTVTLPELAPELALAAPEEDAEQEDAEGEDEDDEDVL